MMARSLVLILLVLVSLSASAQVRVQVVDKATGEALPMATLVSLQSGEGYLTDQEGRSIIPYTGIYTISYTAYLPETVTLTEGMTTVRLEPEAMTFDAIVVSGTRTFKRQTRTPVIVSVISRETLDQVQACNLADGLRFQPGLRMETDCQTCNYTQLRMNGLGGAYSQILINGRPVFSPLTGLYGLEQLPANMIERIEVVRGGGSVLYGSGAIGGTVNVITRLPDQTRAELAWTSHLIGGRTSDHQLNGHMSIVGESGKSGASFFVHTRDRDLFDHNADGFSELPKLSNRSIGTSLFFTPTPDQKLEFSICGIHEYRYGGDMLTTTPHLARQAEERTHDVLIANADYQINFGEGKSAFIAYLAGQSTRREHYTGVLPDDPALLSAHWQNPPYGQSDNLTWQGGFQVNHRLTHGPGVGQVLTLGAEILQDDVFDQIPAYGFTIDQVSRNWAVFGQSDWQISPVLNLLTGLRMDNHNLVGDPVWNPRIALLYRPRSNTQFRLAYGRGFRAPQAFDADMHIAFAGGGVSRISIDPGLTEERSTSLTASVNMDHATDHWVAGFTLEAFHTRLSDAFWLDPDGEDAFGQRFIKRNGPGSTVQGALLEIRANVDQQVQLEAGLTVQSSLFDQPVLYSDELPARDGYLRTPDQYGFATLTLFPQGRWTTNLNLVYTGRMDILHFAGAPEQPVDQYARTPAFWEWSLRTGYTFSPKGRDYGIEAFMGIRNITSAYQDDFDSGKNRDSNYIYGPALPRTVFAGLKWNINGKGGK